MSGYILAARRTAVVPRGGAFRHLSLQALAAPVIGACLEDAGIAAEEVDEVIVSNALGAGGNPARLVALAAGLPERVAGLSIDRQCAGGLDAVLLARAMVASGMADVVVAGGVESYSRRPLRLATDPDGGAALEYDRPAFSPWPERDPEMHVAAAALAERLGILRDAQDAWTIESHRKGLAKQGIAGEIVALDGQDLDPYTRVLRPEIMRRAKGLAGTVTMANAAVAADAAAFVVVVSERRARGTRALRINEGLTLGGRPEEPGLAPVAAISQVLDRAGIAPGDLQVAEIMEAYAVQAMACVQGAGIDPHVVNPGGGALARGHPIGASGAILAVRLFHQLRAGYG
ncbi:MAG: thiolase family protein, partial [bacterium]